MNGRAIKGAGTAPERAMARALRGLGLRPRLNVKTLPGTPDLVLGDLCVMVNGCFWHACPAHGSMPKTNTAFWRAKLESNVRRDRRVRRRLNALGYRVRTVWEHDDVARAAARIARAL